MSEIEVNALEWSSHEGDGVLTADTVAGEYRVRCHDGDLWVASHDGIPLSNRPYELSSFAKAAAQRDFDARIRSALRNDARQWFPIKAEPVVVLNVDHHGCVRYASGDPVALVAPPSTPPVPIKAAEGEQS